MSWITFLKLLPEVYGLYQSIQKRIKEVETDRNVKDDIRSIKEAFDEKDPSKLNHIFNTQLSDKLKE